MYEYESIIPARKPKPPARAHKPQRVMMAGVLVWHLPGYEVPVGTGYMEPVTYLGSELAIRGGDREPITVRQSIITWRKRLEDRTHVVAHFDLTRATPDLGSHEAVVRYWSWVFGIGQDGKQVAT